MSSLPEAPRWDMIVVGEFCEQGGPKVVDLMDFEGAFPPEARDEATEESLQSFMMRAMSGNHVYDQSEGSTSVESRSAEIVIDQCKWADGSPFAAFVHSFTLPDLYARGYTRTAVIAFLSDEYKLFSMAELLSTEFQVVADKIRVAMEQKHKEELLYALAVTDQFTNPITGEESPLLTPLLKSTMVSEREMMQRRLARLHTRGNNTLQPQSKSKRMGPLGSFQDPAAGFGSAPVGTPDTQESMGELAKSNSSNLYTEEDGIKVLNKLQTVHKPLRPFTELIHDTYEEVLGILVRATRLYAQSLVALAESMEQLVCPVCNLPPSKTLTSLFEDKDVSNKKYFKIGDFIAMDPTLSHEQVSDPAQRWVRATALYDSNLFQLLVSFKSVIVDVAYNALRGIPIIVVGESKQVVLQALRVAATFVPCLWQSKTKFRTAVMEFPQGKGTVKAFVTPQMILENALIGAPTNAALTNKGTPILSDACVWKVIKKSEDRIECTLHGGERYVIDKKRAAASTMIASANAGQLFEQGDQPIGEGVGFYAALGLLAELNDLLQVKIRMSEVERVAMSNFLRLTLKRIFVDLTSMAAMCRAMLAPSQLPNRPSTENLYDSFPHFSISSAPGATKPAVQIRATLTAHDVAKELDKLGFAPLHQCDVHIVTGLVYRMLLFEAENDGMVNIPSHLGPIRSLC